MHVGTNGLCVRSNTPMFMFHSDGADARAVRPYTAIMAVLICKMVEIVRCSNACRDARPVRPLKHPHVYVSIPMGADARAVRPYIVIMAVRLFQVCYFSRSGRSRLVRSMA